MTDVFISYSRNDRNDVRFVAHALTAEGFSVWWDPEIKPGKKWNDVIRRSLDSAAVVLTCWTPASVKSQWVVAETNAGHQRDMLVPVLLKNSHPPIPFNMMQAPDLTRWRGNANDPEWRAVLGEVRRLVERKRRAIVAAPPPGEAQGREFDGRATSSAQTQANYRVSRTQGRAGPRISRFIMGTVVIGAVLTAGLWAGEYATRAPSSPAPAPAIAPSPAPTPTPADIVAPPPEPAPATPAITEPEPKAEPPRPRPRPRPAPPPTQAATPTPISTPATPVPVRENHPDDVASVDSCAVRLARMCPEGRGETPVFFSANRNLSGSERRFLRVLQVNTQPVLSGTVAQCDAMLASHRTPDGFNRACGTLIFASQIFTRPTPPAATAPATPAPSSGTTPTGTAPTGTTTGTRPPLRDSAVINRQGPGLSTATQPTGPVIN